MASLRTSARDFRSWYFRWMSDEEMKVWIRGEAASATASQARSMSAAFARASARDLAAPDLPGDLLDGGEIALRGDRETGLDDVHAHFFELAGDPQFLVRVHARPRRLLAVPERRVENKNPLSCFLHHSLLSHEIKKAMGLSPMAFRF